MKIFMTDLAYTCGLMSVWVIIGYVVHLVFTVARGL